MSLSETFPSLEPERRRTDRRNRATPMLSRYTLFGGRRRGARRSGASSEQYVDRYPGGLAAALVAIGVLCSLDAVFTLLYIQKGGEEANPVMRALMGSTSPQTFVLLKCLVTNLGLVVLCLHKNFRYVKAVIGALLATYVALLLYHLYLASVVA